MSGLDTDFETLAPQLIEIARLAGCAILEIYGQHCSETENSSSALVMQKADASPLTLADLASHRVICEGLRRLTPDIPIVSEEDAESLAYRSATGEFWLLDPLDGTKEFLARNGEFTVNIALVRNGEPVLGVVYAPVPDQMYWGGNNQGAFRKSAGTVEPIHVSAPLGAGAQYRVVASKSHLNQETSEFISRLGNASLIQAGSSLKFCRVAEGAADIYPRLGPTCEWDTAAAQAVVEGAGGHVMDLGGERLKYGKPDILNQHFIVFADHLALSFPLAHESSRINQLNAL